MKYQFHDGHQLYIPESLEEQRLVFDRLEDLLEMECSELQLWDPVWDPKERSVTSWFSASAIFPFTVSGGKMARHVDELSNRPGPPYIVTVDVALPVDYRNSALVCRWNNRGKKNDHAETFVEICREVLGKYKWDEGTLLPTLANVLGVPNRRGKVTRSRG